LGGIAAAALAYLSLVALLAVGPSWPARIAAALAIVASIAAWWHARPGYGSARGLPPGSLALAQLGMVQDDRFLLREAERHGPTGGLQLPLEFRSESGASALMVDHAVSSAADAAGDEMRCSSWRLTGQARAAVRASQVNRFML
jgi:hypothetical protein